jgi:hypothetical protein
MFSGIGWRSVSTTRLARSWLVAILAALAAGQLSPVAAGDTLPVKLEIVPSANAVNVGDAVILNVVLRGADNAVAVARRRSTSISRCGRRRGRRPCRMP